MKLAYLVNQYPAVSHSFIRREILAVEALGHQVGRFSIRASAADLPEPLDREEVRRTTVVLSGNLIPLLLSTMARGCRHPARVWRAFRRTRGMAAPTWVGLVRRLAYLVEGIWLARELERSGVRHLHAHFGTNPAAVARVMGLVSGIPYSFTVHGPDEFDQPEHIDLRGKIADAKFVVAISDYGRSQLCRWAAMTDWHKLVVVRCGLGEDQINAEPAKPAKDVDLCTVARLAPQKGLPVLIEALALLAGRGEHPRLLVIGDGPMRADLESLARMHGLEDQITFLGARDGETVAHTLARSRIMVLPSFAEGLPVVIMEAFACGTPVITTSIAGIPELVDDTCGWVVPAASSTQLAEAISSGLGVTDQERVERGRVGRDRVRASHDAGLNAAKLTGYIESGPA